MRTLEHIFKKNRKWAEDTVAQDPGFFERLQRAQSPELLWIGCADSRVPANIITGMTSGDVFVHRNVANLVVHSDINCLSVMQYAVEVLKVKHIIVCGHYGCGGVAACSPELQNGLIDNWLMHINEVREKHMGLLAKVSDETQRHNRLCELNVIEQVRNVCNTTIVYDAWKRGQHLNVHGWIYGLEDGILHDLGICIADRDEMATYYQKAVAEVAKR